MSTDEKPTDDVPGYRGRFWIQTRVYWSSAILIAVGVVSTFHYPRRDQSDFYSTAAQVIVTLFVAMAVEALAGGQSPKRELTTEHWLFLLASTAGLFAAMRGLSTSAVHPWLTGLTVVGVTSTALLVAENIVYARAGSKAALWSPLFILVVLLLIFFP